MYKSAFYCLLLQLGVLLQGACCQDTNFSREVKLTISATPETRVVKGSSETYLSLTAEITNNGPTDIVIPRMADTNPFYVFVYDSKQECLTTPKAIIFDNKSREKPSKPLPPITVPSLGKAKVTFEIVNSDREVLTNLKSGEYVIRAILQNPESKGGISNEVTSNEVVVKF